MIQLEHNYTGLNYILNSKVINLSPSIRWLWHLYQDTGLSSVCQEETSTGIEMLYQQAAFDQVETSVSCTCPGVTYLA
jgi:hypothetical protein